MIRTENCDGENAIKIISRMIHKRECTFLNSNQNNIKHELIIVMFKIIALFLMNKDIIHLRYKYINLYMKETKYNSKKN